MSGVIPCNRLKIAIKGYKRRNLKFKINKFYELS